MKRYIMVCVCVSRSALRSVQEEQSEFTRGQDLTLIPTQIFHPKASKQNGKSSTFLYAPAAIGRPSWGGAADLL